MSWQDYIDVQLIGSGHVSQACIAGLDGNIWAKSEGFNVTPEEMKKVVSGYSDMANLPMNGLWVSGNKYFFLSGDDKVLRAKKGKVGVHVVKTKQAIVVALYEDPIQPQQCALVVEKLGDYLISCGY